MNQVACVYSMSPQAFLMNRSQKHELRIPETRCISSGSGTKKLQSSEGTGNESYSVNDILLRGKGPRINEHHEGSFHAYMAHKISKLGSQNHDASIHAVTQIFKGCYVFINGYTDPPVHELKRMIVANGGAFNQYETSNTTHFVCNQFPQTKLDRLRKGLDKRSIHYVKVSWIIESIKQRKRLDEIDYRPSGLYDEASVKLTSIFSNAAKMIPLGNKRLSSDDDDASIEGVKDELAKRPRLLTTSAAPGAKSSVDDCTAPDSDSSERINSGYHNAISKLNAESDPNFIEHFFESSRLHFIGTWRSRLPDLYDECVASMNANAATGRSDTSSTSRSGESSRRDRVVMHVDMDCFFVSVLLRNRDDLRSIPVAVAHSKAVSKGGFSEISSCNYPARKLGLRNGMFMVEAVKLCPHLQVLPYDFEQYRVVSDQIYRIFFNTGAVVQPVSVDEAYLELPAGTDGYQAAVQLKETIRSLTGCPASVGIGSNMLVARLATKKAKPDGIFLLSDEMLQDSLANLSVSDLPGVGYKHSKVLKEFGCNTCMDVWTTPVEVLKSWLGDALGAQVSKYSRGQDDRELKPIVARKSIGLDINYGIRFTNLENAEVFIYKMAIELASRLEQARMQGRTVTLKLMKRSADANVQTSKFMGHGRCDTASRSHTVSKPINSSQDLYTVLLKLFHEILKGFSLEYVQADDESMRRAVEDLRGIGMHLTKLSTIENSHGQTNQKSASLSSLPSTSTIAKYLQSKAPLSPGLKVVSPPQSALNQNRHEASYRTETNDGTDDRFLQSSTSLHEVQKSAVDSSSLDSSKKNHESEFVTASQFDFLVNMPPELLSQVFEEIRGNGSFREVVVGLNASKHVGHQGEGVARKEIAVPSKFNPPTTLITNHMPSDSCGKYVGLSISRWPSEPMSRIQQSLQQWVLFGEDLMKRCPQSTEHIEIDFPTDGQIDFLCEYAVDLLETRQFEKAVLFYRVVSRVFGKSNGKFQVAVSRVAASLLRCSPNHCFGAQLMIS